ncbi:MAG: RluA family pseudouridine synthase [Oscillospiraceae bacterium]|nr:RluA family pseudouridine synthase [Oscillospiraceae bacterium]
MNSKNNDTVFEVKEDGRLLETVRKELPKLPSGKAKSCLEHRMISVDGIVTSRFDYPVRRGQTVKITRSRSGSYSSPLPVIYEDEYLLAVNKPAGLLSVANELEKENTAIRLLRESGIDPLYVVHRLDRDTSGVLLFSKNAELRDKLQECWDEAVTKREYTSICEGVFLEKRGRRESLLRETEGHIVYSASYGEGRLAITNYEVTKENARYSYLRVLIETGRKNQIRVHMKELGHPIVGDKKYGAHGSPLGRLGLHASVLELTHPKTGKALVIKAPIPAGFRLPSEKD